MLLGVIIKTETPKTGQKAVEEVEKVIRWLGAKVVRMNTKTHDLIVGAVSHLPLAAAVSLVNVAAEADEQELIAKCAAAGFRDTTRIASGDPVLGRDMFQTNRIALLKHLKALRTKLWELEKFIKRQDSGKIEATLRSAQDFQAKISDKLDSPIGF